MLQSIENRIAAEIAASPSQVLAAISLLDEGATVPFIARYRKEATGGLDDIQLRALETRLSYLKDLEARRATILRTIEGQGKLTTDLRDAIGRAETQTALEDLYLPYRPKRTSKADAAREKGLGPLAERLLGDRTVDPQEIALPFVGEGVADAKAALDGARDIVVEAICENAEILSDLRSHVFKVARVRSRVVEGKEASGAKFSDYFDHSEVFEGAPSHRVLALLRGQNEGVLTLDLDIDGDHEGAVKPVEAMIARRYDLRTVNGSPCEKWLLGVVGYAWRVRLLSKVTVEMMVAMKEKADHTAIEVFSRNLKDILLAAPAGAKATMGLDPGIRTGIKVAVVDGTGRLVATSTVYPCQPRNDVQGAKVELFSLIRKHGVELVAIGNGTGSRETDQLVGDVLKEIQGAKPTKIVVSEAGASIYSASEVASIEMPNVDVSLRGAVSIARRLQDPLAELVKIDPKAIGVGQYQHDVDQTNLSKALDTVVEDAVNAVGVDLNSASSALLTRVSGLRPTLADAIVARRDANGRFTDRRQLLEVAGLGAKTFEQCAGFLRIRDGSEPLDASAVHPEAYPLARRIVEASGKDVLTVMGDSKALKVLKPSTFVSESEGFGLPTVKDILSELEKPGRDPRPAFKSATLREGVEEIGDLKPGMTLEGTVTNVAAFGAFVDVGVHQDGLVHVSQLADRFVKDASEIVKAGQIVTVRVVEVDVARKRISLTMRKDAEAMAQRQAPTNAKREPSRKHAPVHSKPERGSFGSALAEALSRR